MKILSFVGTIFDRAGGLDHLYALMTCAPPTIKLQAIRLLSNITSMSRISKSWDWTKFIRPLLGKGMVELNLKVFLNSHNHIHF